MDKDEFEPVAGFLISGYNGTATYSREFRDEYGQPPTLMAKAHHLRSLVQAAVTQDDNFELGADFSEFGRVQLTSREWGWTSVLRGENAVAIERTRRAGLLFDPLPYVQAGELLLIYAFGREGLALSLANTRRKGRRFRLELDGHPVSLGSWGYDYEGDGTPFVQPATDPWAELGHDDLDLGGEGGATK